MPEEENLYLGNIPGENENISSLANMEQPQTTSLKPQTDSMDVHHHSHTERKKLTHYLWEFFMLFLAVTLGFFVENQREHYIENQREKEYIRSLVQDLKEDTAYLENAITSHIQSLKMIDNLIFLLKNKNRNHTTREIYYLARMIPFRDQAILLHDKTFEQLKSSGSLRLIHNASTLNSISAYYETYKWISAGPSVMEIRNRQELFLNLDKVFDMGVFQDMVHSEDPFTPDYPKTEPVLLSNSEQEINSVCARYHFMYTTKKVILKSAQDLTAIASHLILSLNKEYHLK